MVVEAGGEGELCWELGPWLAGSSSLVAGDESHNQYPGLIQAVLQRGPGHAAAPHGF